MEGELESVGVIGLAHCLEPERHALGVAVLAAGADLGAAGQWIPGCLCPLDSRVLRHGSTSFRWKLHDDTIAHRVISAFLSGWLAADAARSFQSLQRCL